MKQGFLSLRNSIDFPLRQFFKWKRPVREVQNESKENLFAFLDSSDRDQIEELAKRLCDQYYLQRLFEASKAEHYRENLFYLHLIESSLKTAGVLLPDPLDVADIGVSHWFYVQALYAALQWWQRDEARNISIWGYEIDAYRVYSDFRSRYDHVMANIADLENTHFVPHPFEEQAEKFGLITMFFPFVFEVDHLKWGLPSSNFDPKTLLSDAWHSLTQQGILFVVNQGEQEHNRQKSLFHELGLRTIAAFEHKSLLYQYEHPRYVLMAIK